MASHASAIKAHRQSLKRREQNRQMRSRLRTGLKAIRTALDREDLDGARALLNQTIGLVDRMAGKGIIHKNTAARYKARIARRVKATAR